MSERSRWENSRVRWAAAIALLAVVAAIMPVSRAAAANTVEGTCTFSGWLTFDPPLGNELRETEFRDYATGACTGMLNGTPQENAPVVIRGKGSGSLSCLAGHTTSSDTLTFMRGTDSNDGDVKIRFFTDTTGALTHFVSRFRGAVSGEGICYVSFLPYADQSALAACQAGSFGSAHYDLTARTITAVVG
jgi:hypothetical protein